MRRTSLTANPLDDGALTLITPSVDPVDVAAAFPNPPAAAGGLSSAAVTSRSEKEDLEADRAFVDRLDGVRSGPAEVVLSAEQLTARTEWTVSGGVRFRRRISTSTRTVEVTVRREELQVEVRDVADHAGAWVGTDHEGPSVPPPPVVTGPGVFVLREEVPDVVLTVHPYERVIVSIDRVTEQLELHETRRREQAVLSGDTGVTHPPQPDHQRDTSA